MKDEAQMLYQLLKDYHAVTQHLKALRSLTQAEDEDDDEFEERREYHRHAATGWFNAVYILWRCKAISRGVLQAVASPRAAELWLTYVAPLDAKVRAEAARLHGRDLPSGAPPVELWWRHYAKKEIVQPPEDAA